MKSKALPYILKYSIAFFLSFCFIGLTQAQKYHINHVENSPSAEIYQLYQDNQGYVWIGTNEGLYRFDGKNYTFFRSNKYTNPIAGIQQDKEGRIWCNNFSGQIFYVEEGELKLFYDFSKNYMNIPDFTVYYFPRIIVFGIGFKENFVSVDFHTKKLVSLFPQFSKITPIKSKQGQITLSTKKESKPQFSHYCLGNFSMDSNLNLTKLYSPQSLQNKMHFSSIMYPYLIQFKMQNKDSINQLLISNLSDTTKKIETNITGQIYGGSFYLDKQDNLWLGTNNGICKINLNTGKTSQLDLLKEEQVSSILPYGKGLLVGTLENGIYEIPNLQVKKNRTEGKRIINLLANDDIGIYGVSNQGDLFHFKEDGTNSKVCQLPLFGDIRLSYDPFENSITGFHKNSYTYFLNSPKNSKIRKNNSFKSFKKCLVVTKDWHLFSSSSTLQFGNINESKELIPFDQSIFPIDSSLKPLTYIPNSKTKLKNTFYRLAYGRAYDFLFFKEKKRIYYSSNLGLDYFINTDKIPIKFQDRIILSKSIAKKGNHVLAGTILGDLLEIKEDKIIHHWNSTLHHQFEHIKKVVYEGEYIFVLDKVSLNRIHIKTNALDIINSSLGINPNKINDILIHRGICYLSSENGLIYFPTNIDLENTNRPTTFIHSIFVNNEEIQFQETSTFNSNENNFKFEFRSLNNSGEKSKKYTYRLLGFQEEWQSNSEDLEYVYFNNLSPGDYTFEVKALNNNNIESIETISYSFLIQKPFYATWWFRIGLFVLFLLAIVTPFYLKAKSVKKEHQMLLSAKQNEQLLAQSKLSSLRAQMNPHFIFNALNSIQEYIILNKQDLASSYLGKFADLMRTYLDQSNKRTITLDEEIRSLKLYLELEKIRFEDQIEIELHIAPNIAVDNIKIPPILLQPYVENAFKHGLLHKKTDKKLTISMQKVGEFIECIIEDNGVGREKSRQINQRRKKSHTSFATSATEQRLELINKNQVQKIEIITTDLFQEEKPTGTKVLIKLPIGYRMK